MTEKEIKIHPCDSPVTNNWPGALDHYKIHEKKKQETPTNKSEENNQNKSPCPICSETWPWSFTSQKNIMNCQMLQSAKILHLSPKKKNYKGTLRLFIL